MSRKVLIDTDILIDFGLGNEDAAQTLATLEEQCELCVSVINTMELYAGCRSKRELKEIDLLLSAFRQLPITQDISNKTLSLVRQFRASHGVEINDMLIASTAQIHNLELISKNQKHYRFLPDLNLLDYPLSNR